MLINADEYFIPYLIIIRYGTKYKVRNNVNIVVHYDNNPFWISPDTNNGFLMTHRQMTLKDVCRYTILENFIGHVCWTLS